MGNYYVCLILQRIILPLVIATCSLIRPVGISLVYLFMFFALPFVPVATSRNIKGPIRAYFIILIVISVILLLSHLGLNAAIWAKHPNELITSCSFIEILLRHIGFISLNNLKPLAIVEWIVPEILMFIISVLIYVLLVKLNAVRTEEPTAETNEREVLNGEHIAEEGVRTARKRSEQLTELTAKNIRKIGPFFSLITIFLASAFQPSVPGGLYFLVFLITTTYWACVGTLKRGFAIVSRFLMVFIIVHTLVFVAYQTPWPQEYLDKESLPARLAGLHVLFISTCNNGEDIRIINFDEKNRFDAYLNPVSLLLCFYVLGLTSNMLLKEKEERKRAFGQIENSAKLNPKVSLTKRTTTLTKPDKWNKTTQKFNIIRKNTTRKNSSRKDDSLSIPLDPLSESVAEVSAQLGVMDQISYGFHSVGGFVYQNSYVFTNIVMMAWSIIYHSWLTFVLLIWANILWMIPNQRKTMLRWSPFVVFYAEMLLVAQYIYGMNLTDDELPRKVKTRGINLEQIGLLKPESLPCVPLIVKTIFTTMFWITLRQLCKEEREKKQTSTLQDMVAPLQLTVGAATADLAAPHDPKSSSKFLERAGEILKTILVKLWIWLLIFVIFLSGITGTKMTGFRIFYMAFFLFFVLAFQLSWKAWTKIMFGFWLVLIFYAMSILILIYTYQFDDFDIYWKQYLNVSKTLQEDIGLENYLTKDLFLHLVNPTLIVIMTVIQVHYFHKNFLASLQEEVTTEARPETPTPDSVVIGERLEEKKAEQKIKELEEESSEMIDKPGTLGSLRRKSKRQIGNLFRKIRGSSTEFIEFLWLFLEIHLIKVIYLVAFVFCVMEVCLLHVFFTVLAVVAMMSCQKAQVVISRLISVIVAALLLAKMIYQVSYINEKKYNVYCDNSTSDTTNVSVPVETINLDHVPNNAEWFGLEKVGPNKSLLSLLKGYIVYLTVVTIHAVVIFRQAHMRASKGIPNVRQYFIFPGTHRQDAEKDLLGLIKYLFNFGFYKFGLEITFIALVALISYRQDLIAILYAFWLCVLFYLKRTNCAKLWVGFQWFTAIAIVEQYLIYVGPPPGACVEYPWLDSPYLKGLQTWAMLPGPNPFARTTKLIFDFFLLMCICRQARVFTTEKRFQNSEFPGGTNKSIIGEIENLGVIPFDNPTPDFIANVRNWLDILKVAVLTGFFWVTLAVVFLSGTNIISCFSVGYLIGSFIFLWQGTDFYLRPINKILKWWYILLAYNVGVITVKTTLQIAGCLFLSPLKENVCLFVHLFGISCTSMSSTVDVAGVVPPTEKCPATKDVTGITWDAICFTFLIFQLRIFSSYYFCHIINDTKASTILASRGAELIEDLRQKQIQYKIKHEKEILRKIKKKMEKIRATQQKMLRPIEKPTHFDEEVTAPLAQSSGLSSCQGSGYHTPIEDNDNEGEGAYDLHIDMPNLIPPTSRTSSLLHTQAPSPSSAVMTVSLEGYLEPKKLSFGSPTNSDLLPSVYHSDDSFPVFSSPPDDSREDKKQLRVIIPTATAESDISGSNIPQTRRQSSFNTVSWSESVKLPKNFDEDTPANIFSTFSFDTDTQKPTNGRQYVHKRNSSLGTTSVLMQDEGSSITENQRRRYSNLSWAQGDTTSIRSGIRTRSWGPYADVYYYESLITEVSIVTSHEESIRAGDYYMFDDLDEKIELDLMDEEADFLEAEGEISPSELKMSKRKNLLEVYKDIEKSRRRRMSQILDERPKRASSAPGSKLGAPTSPDDDILSPPSALSDPLPILKTSEFHEKKDDKKHDEAKKAMPSTSKDQADDSEKPEDEGDKDKAEVEAPLIIRFIEGLMVSIAIRLNRLSRNYRYVMKILEKEKKILKETKGFEIGARTGAGNIWTPFKFIKRPASSDDERSNTLSSQTDTKDHIHDIQKQTDHSNDGFYDDEGIKRPMSAEVKHDTHRQELIQMGEVYRKERKASVLPEIRVLAPSLERGLDDPATALKPKPAKIDERQDDIQTYEEEFTSRDHHIAIEVMIALWYAMLSNTDLVCYVIVFVNQIVSASVLSLPLPLMVFLWGTLALPRPTKTFWVTLIAYTQSVVLIKCVSQVLMIWFSDTASTQTLSAAKIIGIEYRENYATYDLLLLLVLFFHRFILKSQGLWKSDYEETTINEEALVIKDELSSTDNKGSSQDIDDNAIVLKGSETLALIRQDQSDGNQDSMHVSNFVDEPGKYLPGVVKITSVKYCSSVISFFKDLLHKTRLPSDVYALLFFCDFVNFFVLLFGFTAFGSQQGDGGVQTYITDNKVPIPFLIMLLVQFLLIIVDRALYLRKALVYKIIFHFLLVIGLHIWMFFVIPSVTERNFNDKWPPIIFYMIKCFYLLLSSFQIRCGYPTRILGNFLTRSFSLMNMIAFKVYIIIPFLFELRTFMDWVCTDTTMTMFDWLKMEDIFQNIFFIKCSRQLEKDLPSMRAEKKSATVKLIMGGCVILILVVCVWGPLALSALLNTVGHSNLPYEIKLSLKLGPYEPVYQMTAVDNNIHPFDTHMWNSFRSLYRADKSALTFIDSYDQSDVATMELRANSTSLWNISPPNRNLLMDDLYKNRTVTCRLKYTVSRKTQTESSAEAISKEISFELTARHPSRKALINMLENKPTNETFILPEMLPKFIKVKNSGDLGSIPQLLLHTPEYRNLSLRILYGGIDNSSAWWELKEHCKEDDPFYKNILEQLPLMNCNKTIVMYTFNDKLFPSTFSFLTAGGIIGMYATYVLLASRVARGFISGSSQKIMFDDLPYVDRVLQLCLDIYLVREALEFTLEEDLFAKLIFLYRSPETMIKWTRPKEEASDDESETESVRSIRSRVRTEAE